MFFSFLCLLIATMSIQLPNILGMTANEGDGLSFLSAAKITFYTLPITILGTYFYTLFYGRGIMYFTYPAMSVYAKVFALIAAIVVQIFWLRSREVNVTEVIGINVAILGFLVSVFSNDIEEFFKAL